jgi:hypothetical protein
MWDCVACAGSRLLTGVFDPDRARTSPVACSPRRAGSRRGERLRSGERGRFPSAELLAALTEAGHAALGRPEEVPEVVSAPDVTTVVDGRVVVAEGRHALGDVGELLHRAIEPLWAEE